MIATYRSVETSHVDRTFPALAGVLQARVARSFAGGALALTAIAAVLTACVDQNDSFGPELLLMSWPIAAVVYCVVRALLGTAGYGAASDAATMEHALFRWEVAGIALPLAGLAFAAPLTLHSVFPLLGDGSLQKYGQWMMMSAVLVGHAHLALAVHGWWFAAKLHGLPSGDPLFPKTVGIEHGWFGGLAVAVTCAAIPGLVLFAIPPVITLATGAVFIPVAYATTKRIFERERCAIALALSE